MKFKEIKPGMAIHCPTEEDARALLEHLDSLGYKWNEGGRFRETHYAEGDTYYLSCIAGDEHPLSVMQGYYANGIERGVEITEFSDLIEPEPPMSAAEVLEWFKRLYQSDDYNDAFDDMLDGYGISDLFEKYSPQKIVDKITAYEAAKKAPKPVEVEWVGICRIIQVQDNGFKKCVYEEVLPENDSCMDYQNTENILKKYIAEHDGEYIAVVEEICRVKGDSNEQ